MSRSDASRESPPACWDCGSELPVERLESESVIHARGRARGGPYLSFPCPACRLDVGLLQDGRGRWLVYPLEGRDTSPKLDFVYSRGERDRLGRARDWWTVHAGRVDAFPAVPRAAPKPQSGKQTAGRRRRKPPPQPRAGPQPGPRPDPEPEEPPPRRRSPRKKRPDPYELLGVERGASEKEIAAAYRAALKLCHPDRVANLDAEFQELAHRKAKALRKAYERLLREAQGG